MCFQGEITIIKIIKNWVLLNIFLTEVISYEILVIRHGCVTNKHFFKCLKQAAPTELTSLQLAAQCGPAEGARLVVRGRPGHLRAAVLIRGLGWETGPTGPCCTKPRIFQKVSLGLFSWQMLSSKSVKSHKAS